MNKTLLSMLIISILTNPLLTIKAQAPITVEDYAVICGVSVEEFELISSVVEAESDRSESLEGRILIALTILNRVEDNRFPDTITEVLTQRGQFSTVRNGHSVTERTAYSDRAVLEAVEWMESGDYPNVEFFNCRGFFSGYPQYELVDGNYFSLGG